MTQKEIDIQLDPVRGQVVNFSRMLPVGAKYYTIEAKNVDKTYDERKATIATNPTSPELLMNRAPRVIVVTDHSVFNQEFAVDMEGNNVVTFNKGMSDEAQAAVVLGGANFGQTTDDAMKDAINGEVRIFADGIKTATKANMLNQNELERWIAEKNRIQCYIDSIKSTIASNKKKVEDYQESMKKFKPAIDLGNGPVTVTVE